ncbi:hypothetical protein SSX86_008066 [Deinandra increscens subsp. villosa]|uniref:UBA domain-containing protein n=1 Tax=Deinandra increscens subsp. villosa TaxID=3103831 RepID=A0AAP0H4R5_9ASTR
MDYDFRNRLNPPYNSQPSVYNNRPTPPSSHPMYGAASLYPKIGPSGGHSVVPPPARNNNTNTTSSSSSSSSSGMGIRVTLKPEFRITPPPQMSPHVGEIPRSTFQFDFELERKILAEAEKENPNWSKLGLENISHKTAQPISRANSSVGVDPVVAKYISTGLNRDAVPIAVAKYGDNPMKVKEFVNGYTVLREMGFEANSVAEALFTHDNDKEAAAHFLSTSS